MRKIYITLLIAILCGGCTSRRPADGEPLYVSILPLRSLVQGIVGDDFDIEVLVLSCKRWPLSSRLRQNQG